MVNVTPLNAFDDNYIWVISVGSDSRSVLVVDPGDEGPVFDALEQSGASLSAILVTHHHHDHTGGIEALVSRYSVPVYGPADEPVAAVGHPLSDGDRIKLLDGGLTLEVMRLPGHTRGHLAYYGAGAIFCGDTLFTAGCGRLFEGSAEEMQYSLARIRALPPATRVYCAHEYTLANLSFALVVEPESGEIAARVAESQQLRAENLPTVPSTLAIECATNPFLRWDQPQVVAAAERFAGHRLATPAEVFATLRYWKDTLD
jgi:hydroxyacylglutathione hydrolase